MKKITYLFIIFVAGLLQVALLDSIKIFNVKPDLLLIGTVIAALYFDLKWALVLAIFCGILKDIFGINTFGISILLFPLWSFCVVKLAKNMHLDNNFVCMALVFILGIFNSIITKLIFLWLGAFIPLGIFLRITFLEALYTALVSLLVFKLSEAISCGGRSPT